MLLCFSLLGAFTQNFPLCDISSEICVGEKWEGEKTWGFPPPQDPFIKWSKCAPLTQKFFWGDFYVLLGHTRYDFQKVHEQPFFLMPSKKKVLFLRFFTV
jgi:hypothetical protein